MIANVTNRRNPELYALFEKIAWDTLQIDTLEARHDIALDNHIVSVRSVCEAFQRVYELGRQRR